MRLTADSTVDLTYCTNIHAADGWTAVRANIARYGRALKARLSPHAPMGIGLRLSAREATELLGADRLEQFRSFLDDEGLYVAVINGFPYGPFHGTPVKAQVYAPDWRDPARADYTRDLVRILTRLLPAGADGGVSTAPISYKAWMNWADESAWIAVRRNIEDAVEAMYRARETHGVHLHLDIEPEPDCVVETTDEAIALFADKLIPAMRPSLARRLGIGEDDAERALRDHVQICFDCCHVSVEHEDPLIAIERLTAAGIGIGRVQLSSALRVAVPDSAAGLDAVEATLRPFADATYLHQVVCRRAGGLVHAADLDEAFAARHAGEWRVHFHVPLFLREFGALGSTQDDVARVIGHARTHGFTRHLEIETYTWGVLPDGVKLDLADSIAREYEWVLGVLR